MTAPGPATIQVREGWPEQTAAWDELSRRTGNFVQSTCFDLAQSFFGVQPVYFSAVQDGRLVAGVKLYRSASGRLPWLTRRLRLEFMQLGELLCDETAEPAELKKALSAEVSRYLAAQHAVSFRVSGVYGGMEGLIAPEVMPAREAQFNVAAVGLDRDTDPIWQGLHKSHRTEVRKAERQGVTFRREDGIERFVQLLDETYRGQDVDGPERAYVHHAYEALRERAMDLFFAVRDTDYLAGALCYRWGSVAYWQFGGTRRQSLGAGAFLHWEIMKYYAAQGVRRYVLGQVAAQEDPANAKFSVGISRFKRHFGPEERPSATRLYVMRPWRHAMWTRLTQWTTRK